MSRQFLMFFSSLHILHVFLFRHVETSLNDLLFDLEDQILALTHKKQLYAPPQGRKEENLSEPNKITLKQ